MPNTRPSRSSLLSVCAGLSLLLGAACSTGVSPSVDDIRKNIAYQPERSATQIDASASVEATVTEDESIRNRLRQTGRYSDVALANHPKALAETLINDLVNSGLFARIVPAGDPKADYRVIILDEESRFPDWIVRITLRVIEAGSGQEISVHTQEVAAGMTPYQNLFPQMMAKLKTQALADLMEHNRQKQEQAARSEAAVFQQTPLAGLLTGSDKWVSLARERNRAIIAAKVRQLPAILRDSKTEVLTALVVTIEQTILDLNHESEVTKDRAQQAMANNGPAGRIEELRGLTISYRERIELLKPILAALKEEIANRSR